MAADYEEAHEALEQKGEKAVASAEKAVEAHQEMDKAIDTVEEKKEEAAAVAESAESRSLRQSSRSLAGQHVSARSRRASPLSLCLLPF